MSTQNIVIIVVAVVVLAIILIYNNLVGKKNGVNKSAKNIDVYLQKRYDLMNNLFALSERAMQHEKEIHTKIAELRKNFQTIDKNNTNVAQLDKQLNSVQSKLNIIVEQYPQLRGIEVVAKTMDANIIVENEIASCRVQYNDNVELYVNALETFPGNVFGLIFGFSKKAFDYIEVPEEKKKDVVPFFADKVKE